MTREEFRKEVLDFTLKNKEDIFSQIKKLGASCDWSRSKFTLDDDIVDLVCDTFQKMYDDGLIYKDKRIVNYCPKHRTTLSDLEVKYLEKESSFYHIKYIDTTSDNYLTVATTRPETIPGDLAVAVNPEDPNLKDWIGKKVYEPFSKREIPVVGDEAAIIGFGTGALKITPSHDPTDFQVGKRHNLGQRQVISTDNKMNDLANELEGLKPIEAREKIIQILKDNNTFIKEEKIKNQISVCYKCETPIEPLVMNQWFIDVHKKIKNLNLSLQEIALKTIKEKEIEIFPSRYEKVYFHWIENLQDWNISRQIYWGIPIPIWYCENDKCPFIVSKTKPEACPHCGSKNLTQETDVFDTWFSSGQWPYTTLKTTNAFEEFYPTSIMETGNDILFFWVARMIMFSKYLTNKVPFEKVLLHGLVRDKDGQKMSKSKGNTQDPIEIVETYGADVLRFSLIMGTTIGEDMSFSQDRLKGARNFINKVYNASKFVLYNIEDFNFEKPELNEKYTIYIEEAKQVIQHEKENLDNLNIPIALENIYKYFWFTFADKIIEELKEDLKDEKLKPQAQYTLYTILKDLIFILHPFIPYVTEYIYELLPNTKEMLIKERF